MTPDRNEARTVDVFELARTHGRVEGELSLRSAQRLAPMLANAQGVLRYRFEGGTDHFGRPAARLLLSGTLSPKCDRCGGAVDIELDVDARFRFVQTEDELNALPIEEDEVEEPLVGSRHFDLAALVEDEAILSLPISPRHAHCAGTAAPAADAGESEPERPHPFAALAQLKSGKR